MAATAAESLSTEQKARLHEVADLMLQIYETMAEMCYICPAGIIRGPHSITAETEQQYKDLELDPAITYLYSILPYIDSAAADANCFFQRSHFFNHMKSIDVKHGRDPWYRDPNGGFDDEDGQYMRPWYTPLTDIWERSPVMIYDAKEHRIWIANYDTSTDPFFYPQWYGNLRDQDDDKSDWGGTGGYSDWSEKDEGEDDGQSAASVGSSEFWDDEDELLDKDELNDLRTDQSIPVDFDEGFEIVEEISWNEQRAALHIKNENSLDLIQSRDAGDVLRDINRWYRELKEVPDKYGGGGGPQVEEKTRRSLYRKHGWPDGFNAQAFTVDLIRTNAAERAAAHVLDRDPPEIVRKCQKRLEWCRRYRVKFTSPVNAAQTPDEEWIARLKLLHFDLGMARHERDIKEAEEQLARESTEGERSDEELASLREYEIIREDVGAQRLSAARWTETLSSSDTSDPNYRYWKTLAGHVTRLMPFYETALVEARADAQRISPAKFVRPNTASRIESEKSSLAWSLEELRKVKELLSDVPNDAVKAREGVAEDVERLESTVEAAQVRILSLEESLQNDRYED